MRSLISINSLTPDKFMDAKELLNASIKETIVPYLKKDGYKKRAFTWVKECKEVSKVLNIQGSQYNLKTDSRYTVNLGIFHHDFHMERMGFLGKSLSESSCDVRIRIGELMHGRDHWWELNTYSDNQRVLEDMMNNIETHAYKWLDSYNSLQDMYDQFKKDSCFYDCAIAAHFLGIDPIPHLKDAANNANEYFFRTIQKWAKKHGYDF